jgi:hypothetical protein
MYKMKNPKIIYQLYGALMRLFATNQPPILDSNKIFSPVKQIQNKQFRHLIKQISQKISALHAKTLLFQSFISFLTGRVRNKYELNSFFFNLYRWEKYFDIRSLD